MTAAKARRPPTIHDVAREAGVSLPTVSRVFAGTTRVSDERKTQVLEAVKRLGYRPNGAARALVQGRQQPIIGVITPDFTYGSARMVAAVEREARALEYVVAMAVVDPYDPARLAPALEVLLAQPIEGVVVLDFNRYDLVALQGLIGDVPLLTIASRADSLHEVVLDDYTAARQLTEYLLRLGHRTVHHVSFAGPRGETHARELGWRDALSAAGAQVPRPIHVDLKIHVEHLADVGESAVEFLLKDPTLTAVFCANDELAFGVMRALADRDIDVPSQVSVVGIDDEPLARFWSPRLTTYRLDLDWVGIAAVRALVRPGEQLATAPEVGLIERSSAAPPRQSVLPQLSS